MKNILIALFTLCCLSLTAAAFAGQPGRASQGYFLAEQLADMLETAANKMEDGLSVKSMLSKPYKANDRVVVDFSPPGYPRGMSFSLDNMLPDGSSNTLSFNVEPRDGARPNSNLITICALILLYSCPPDAYDNDALNQIDRAISNGKSVTINGWTYSGELEDDAPYFSITAPSAR